MSAASRYLLWQTSHPACNRFFNCLCVCVCVHMPMHTNSVSQMKPGGLLINVSRGGLVENAALVSGMESGQLGGVGLDTYEGEGR